MWKLVFFQLGWFDSLCQNMKKFYNEELSKIVANSWAFAHLTVPIFKILLMKLNILSTKVLWELLSNFYLISFFRRIIHDQETFIIILRLHKSKAQPGQCFLTICHIGSLVSRIHEEHGNSELWSEMGNGENLRLFSQPVCLKVHSLLRVWLSVMS